VFTVQTKRRMITCFESRTNNQPSASPRLVKEKQ